jgi:hypothetical protein
LVKDKILCFVCAVKNIETTFNTYYELQEHLYRDHDMKKDPAMHLPRESPEREGRSIGKILTHSQ